LGVSGTPAGLAVADLDRDGRQDLAIAAPGVTRIWILLNQGTAPVDVPARTVEAARLSVSPNPTRGDRVGIDYVVSHAGNVRLDVVDVQGRRVQMLDFGAKNAGLHRAIWNGRNDRGPVNAGLYFVRYQGVGEAVMKRVVLTR
jgi:hypothetical protein